MAHPEVLKFLHEIAAKGGRAKSPLKTLSCQENARRPRPNARGKPKIRKPKPAVAVPEPAAQV